MCNFGIFGQANKNEAIGKGFEKMKVTIEEGCIGCGLCANVCPNVFRMTDGGVAEVFAQPDPVDETNAQEAADGCPVSVITTEE